MLNKPKKCCDCGSYECSVPMSLNGRVRDIDLCVSHLVAALNAGGVITLASCCGHGKRPGNIVLEDSSLGETVLTIHSASGCDRGKSEKYRTLKSWLEENDVCERERNLPILVPLKELTIHIIKRTWTICEESECKYYTCWKENGLEHRLFARKTRTDL